MTLSKGDWIFISIYIIILAVVTIWHMKKKESANDFLLAGRKLTLPVFVGTLVSTWYGGIFAVSELVHWYGLGAWLIQGIFWYIVYLIFALFLATKINAMPFYTIPDILEDRFGKKAAFLGGIFTYIMINPAPYLLSLGIVVAYFTGISLFWAIIITTIICVCYTSFAGFRGVVYTDMFQFLWMFCAFILLFYFSVRQWGGYEYLQQNLTGEHLKITGDMSLSVMFVWAVLACWVFVDPNFYQRCLAAKSGKTARNGILICILFWCIFDIVAIGSAMYAFAASNAGEIALPEAQKAYLVTADYLLPSPLKGLFLAGIISTIMSTTDSFLFVAAVNISRDYYWRYLNRTADDDKIIAITRLAILITALLAAMLAIILPQIVQLWYILGNVGLSGLLVPTLYTFFGKKVREEAAIFSMLAGFLIAFSWVVIGVYYMQNGALQYPYGIDPLYVGLPSSFIMFFIPLIFSNSKKS